MDKYIKIFLRNILMNKDNLSHYIDSLYRGGHDHNDLNEMFGFLRESGYISCTYADNRVYSVKLTLKGKQLTDSQLRLSDKEELQMLIEEIDLIESLFHKTTGTFAGFDVIYDVPKFHEWLQQVILYLQSIYDQTKDTFIWDTINTCNRRMSGTNDKKIFNEIAGKLKSIGKNIDKYYADVPKKKEEEGNMSQVKTPKIFISHSSKDKQHVELIVQILKEMGLSQDMIFCSSVPGYDIGLSEDIFQTLFDMFNKHELYMIFVHSNNYYASAVSLNEMGAAWVLKTKFCSLLLPGFKLSDMNGVVNSNTISIKMDTDRRDVQNRLNQLYDEISNFSGIGRNTSVVWETARDEFIDKVNAIRVVDENELSDMAIKIMMEAEQDDRGVVLVVKSYDGVIVQAGSKKMNTQGIRREEAKTQAAVMELVKKGYLSQSDSKGELFQLTNIAYEYVDCLLK